MDPLDRKLVGDEAEQTAQRYLEQRGLNLLQKNYQKKVGEIDLIMQDGDFTVFVEVRYRDNNEHGGSVCSINHNKQRKIIRAAQCYIQEIDDVELPCRFDIVGIEGQDQIEWIQDAFSL